MARIFSRFRALCSIEYRIPEDYSRTLLSVKPKIISLTPAEAGHNTVKQREYHPDTSLPALAAPGFYSSNKRAAICKNRHRKLWAYDGLPGSYSSNLARRMAAVPQSGPEVPLWECSDASWRF